MSETFLYLTTIGRKSGQMHRIEIWYVVHEQRYYIVSEHRDAAHWVKNILANPSVRFSVGTRENNESVLALTDGHGRTLEEAQHPELVATISKAMNDKYNWSDGLIVQLESV